MKKPHNFKLSDETFEILQKQAEEGSRSMAQQIEYLVLKESKLTR
jgi:hypothetical protein